MSKKQGPSTKPAVAFVLQDSALQNMRRKVAHLARLLENGEDLSEAPKSLREFNAWAFAAKDPQLSFTKNANETLRKYADLRSNLEALFPLVIQARRPKVRPRDASVQRAREQVRMHLIIRQIAEREVLRLAQENADLRNAVAGLRGKIDSMAEEAARLRDDLESELQVVRQQHAEVLKAFPKNLRPIRGK